MNVALFVLIVIATAIGLSGLGLFLRRQVGLWQLTWRLQEMAEDTEKRRQQEYEKHQKISEEYRRIRNEKIEFMKKLDYEAVLGTDNELWIERGPNSRIKKLYELGGQRVPLASLASSQAAQVIGVVPEIWYLKEHISAQQLMQDDYEVRIERPKLLI